MSVRLRRIAVHGFRKFREPFAIEGLADGLNIVIEPNETGKSTLLEALRAGFFVRHGTKNQLAQSYAPHGEAIGPEVQIAFEVDGAPWTINKRFLKSASIDVSGPIGRAQGDEAEARLHALLGSVKDTSQRGDVAAYGALGLLWVGQKEALDVTAPGEIVRDSVRSTLESEVGAIMGGGAYERVRGRLDTQFGEYWTPTGQKRGRQNDARARLDEAQAAVQDAAGRLSALEQTFSGLEAARLRLKVLQRDMADETDAKALEGLLASQAVAQTASQILATRHAECEAADRKVQSLEDLWRRHGAAVADRDAAQTSLNDIQSQRADLAAALMDAQQRLAEARVATELARDQRLQARNALTAGEDSVKRSHRASAITEARLRYRELLSLEAALAEATALAATLISADDLNELEASDRAIAQASAIVNAGATRVRVEGDTAAVTVDGAPALAETFLITRETRIQVGGAVLLVTPPSGAASAEEALAEATQRRQAALDDLGIVDLAAARARNEAARDAAGELRALQARIETTTPADDVIDLEPGPDALKLFITGLDDQDAAPLAASCDIAALTQARDEAETELARAEGVRESTLAALKIAEDDLTPLVATEAGLMSDLGNAIAQIEAIAERPEFAALEAGLDQARTEAAGAAVGLEEAKRHATAHDLEDILRKIATIDARAKAAVEAHTVHVTEIARLEATIESEGGKGLADRDAGARDELDAARSAHQRVSEEAETLKLLRDTLDEARNEMSAKFVGPVAKRAKRYIDRLLPGSDLSFSEDLALDAVIRAGVSEGCEHLSRGTQEQLAVLTRLAFADLLLEQGRPVSLILDDPLVYSDDARLDLVLEILSEAAERMQVIILTCRERAFRHVSAKRLHLGQAAA